MICSCEVCLDSNVLMSVMRRSGAVPTVISRACREVYVPWHGVAKARLESRVSRVKLSELYLSAAEVAAYHFNLLNLSDWSVSGRRSQAQLYAIYSGVNSTN